MFSMCLLKYGRMQNYCQSFYAYCEIGRMIVEEEQCCIWYVAFERAVCLFIEELRKSFFRRQSEEYPVVLQGLF